MESKLSGTTQSSPLPLSEVKDATEIRLFGQGTRVVGRVLNLERNRDSSELSDDPDNVEHLDFDVDLDDANVVTSIAGTLLGKNWHLPVLDVDIPVRLVESSTPHHGHLYIDHLLTWPQYKALLEALAEAGIIEVGYAGASIARGHTAVRLPWVQKELF
jgi:hypothetical protein